MAYERNSENYYFTQFADTTMKLCPYCGTAYPNWLEEGYNVDWRLGYFFEMGYKFRCSQCGGEIEFRVHTKDHFFQHKFRHIIMKSAGNGTMNRNLVGYEISFDDLKKLTNMSIQAEGYCTKCGGPLRSGTLFCTSCGHKQKDIVPFKSDEKPCINCGSAIKKREKFCINCGAEQPEKYIEEEKTIGQCERCGYKFKQEVAFCPNCRLEQKSSMSINSKFCTSCGIMIKKDAVFCTNCGEVQKQR